MVQPVLLVQGFQRAFVDIGSPAFSISASLRRSTCEQILKFARTSGWTIIHSYLDSNSDSTDAAALDGFTPWPGEAYVRQQTLSAFRAPPLEAKLNRLDGAPIYMISFAGIAVIGATFFDALERRLPLYLVINATADAGRTRLSEHKGLAALEAMASAVNRAVHWPDLQTSGTLDTMLISNMAGRAEPGVATASPKTRREVRELADLLCLAQRLLDEAPRLVARPDELAKSLESVMTELDLALRTRRETVHPGYDHWS